MSNQLTVVVRFSDAKDLENQLKTLDIPENDKIEVLCMGWRSENEYEDAKTKVHTGSNMHFFHTEGSYALARTRAIHFATGKFVIFPVLSSIYDWTNILAALTHAQEKEADAVVMKSMNRKHMQNRESGKGPWLFNIQDNRQNFFQALGYSLSNIAFANNLLKEACSMPCCHICHDNVFLLALAFMGNTFMVSGTATNGIKKNTALEKPADLKKAYKKDSYESSLELIMKYLQDVTDKDDALLLDSYLRALSFNIKALLILSKKYEFRKLILDTVSENEFTFSFFQSKQLPEWKSFASASFTFIKWAMLMHKKKYKLATYSLLDAKLVAKSDVEHPTVSMIVPVYNCDKNLEETIRSALNQTFREFELICVNDGSTDNSLEILKSLAAEDKRISVYSQPNMGQSVARNVGISHAKGKYVYFFDSDDLLSPDLLESAINEMENKELDMVLFDATTFYESNDLKHDHDAFNTYYVRKHEYSSPRPGTILLHEMNENGEYRVSPCLFVVEKRLITNNDIQFIPGIIHEDNAFAFEIMNCATNVAHINKAFYRRRIREDSVMTSFKTFNNSYGYFVCAWKLLSRDYKVVPKYAKTAYDLAVTLGYQMLRNAQSDLIHSHNGEEGGAYALDDNEFKLYLLSVLDRANAKKAKDKLKEKSTDLKDKLAESKKENTKLKIRNKSLESSTKTQKPKGKRKQKGLFASLKNSFHQFEILHDHKH